MNQLDFIFNFYQKVLNANSKQHALLINRDKRKPYIHETLSPKYILKIYQKQLFDIIAMTPRGTLWLCCIHIAQLVIHSAVYTLPFTLQLLFGILQRVTKSQKVFISSHDVLLQKLHNIVFA